MYLIDIRNVHDALPAALYLLKDVGIKRDSRNGPVITFPMPVTTRYQKPTERVMFWEERDANPFFHLFESLWMLGGRNDVEYLTRFVKTMDQFSDNGKTFHGAYGFRWRTLFGVDQLKLIAQRLKENPEDRRQVLQMYSAEDDLIVQEGRKDIPCNLMITFQVSAGNVLDMMVFNRSNDIVWGCYGANAVHFSVLQEYMAAQIGCEVGNYWQVSHNLHAYLTTLEPVAHMADEFDPANRSVSPYDDVVSLKPFPLVKDPVRWDQELKMFLDEGEAIGYEEPFFRKIALPMLRAHDHYTQIEGSDRYEMALASLENMPDDNDWRHACADWVRRRKLKFEQKQQGKENENPS